ncbi:mycofactocin system transcriptional regulator [Arthrobacter sp. FW305-BF8]|uniref:mycofactocin system transcriptional regulator n=1 Tax=Arthrobacter sp. FW305-BF8 TaxID=2879617 RepID=UPI001EEEACB1|nr:mycofactocin system transcriptional regulator [Arthrobacter sp. FW305-BF8]UKA55222.1 mycofactocin system transcriptional regulator [Arthrobacter sp. FW305-BF8]
MTVFTNRSPGRKAVTDHASIERAAFKLFEEQGFDETTMEQIAKAVGVGRRTLFRYFPSKNDIPWGQFDQSLRDFAAQLASVPSEVPIAEAVHRCVVAFNRFDEQSLPQHRIRMRLILGTPTLQAHSALRYEAWRGVIEDYVADRLGTSSDALVPRLAGHVSLALAVSSYEQWLLEPGSDLTVILQMEMDALRSYLQ